jgi:UPF0755 protein
MNKTQRKSTFFGKAFRTLFVLFTLLFITTVVGWFWLSQEIDRLHEHGAENKTITIEPGTGTSAIIERLNKEGILASTLPTRLWLKTVARNQKFKAGDYEFKSPISPRQVIEILVRASIATREYTIPEGYNQYDIARVLAGLPALKQKETSPDKVLGLLKKTSLIADIDPEARTLEGYLFPDTYEYTTKTTREQQVEAMVKRFRKVYTPELQNRAQELGMTSRQVITLASLIEKEAKVDSERELISQVFHKRLKMGAPLACDPTLIYAALLENKYRGKIYRSDLERKSPYNTYKNPGLPPGPIASPGQRSIQAALYPADTDYLFFVVDVTKNDGSHKFSASSKEHDAAVRRLRAQEREQSSQR